MANTDEPLRIDWATEEAARFACEHWHYSKSIPMPPMVRIGVWEARRFIGVVLFSRGASRTCCAATGSRRAKAVNSRGWH